MSVRLELKGRDVTPYLKRSLYEILDGARWFHEIGLGASVYDLTHYSSILLSMLEDEAVIRDVSEAEDVLSAVNSMLEEFSEARHYEIEDSDVFMALEVGERLMENGSEFKMESWLIEKIDSLWGASEAAVENLWVGGMLYADEIADRIAMILHHASDIAYSFGSLEMIEPVYDLDYSSYFSSKYHEYYSVYVKAGCTLCFAPQGLKRLNALARKLHGREKFLDDFLAKYRTIDIKSMSLDDIASLLQDFPGVDRRVEIIRRLTHEKDMVYDGFSTFDPRSTIDFLIGEIARDYYGGVYVPLGEDEYSYRCIVPQLRNRWLEKHNLSR